MRRAVAVALLLLLLPVSPGAIAQQATGVELRDVTVTTQPDSVTVMVKTSGEPKYQAELMDHPYRLVVDFNDTSYGWRKTPLSVDSDPLKQIRGSQYRRGVARVVVELTRNVGYAIREESNGLAIVIPTAATARGAEPVDTAKPAAAKAAAAPKPAATAALAVKPEAKTETAKPETMKAEPVKPETAKPDPMRPVAKAEPAPLPPLPQWPRRRPLRCRAPTAPPQPAPTITPSPTGGARLISLDFKDADVVNLLRILAAESGRNVVIGEDVKGKMSITLRNVPWDLALDTVLEAKGLVKLERDNVMRIVSGEQLAKEREAKFKLEESKVKAETEIRTKQAEAVLKEQEALARQVAAQQAAEELARARSPEGRDAPAVLRRPGGSRQDARGHPRSRPWRHGPLGADVRPRHHPGSAVLAAVRPRPDAGRAALAVGRRAGQGHHDPGAQADQLALHAPLLGGHGPDQGPHPREARHPAAPGEDRSADGDPRPQRPLRPRRAVGRRRRGHRQPGHPGRSRLHQPGGQHARTQRRYRGERSRDAAQPEPQRGHPRRRHAAARELADAACRTGGNLVNLPISSILPGVVSSGVAGIAFGIVGSRLNLNLALEALKSEGKTRTLARPEIVTVENNKASISLGEEIPYATVSSAGTQIQFKEAVLKLEVTPTVVREGDSNRIKMTVIVENNSRGAVVDLGSSGGQPPAINKRKAETQVLIKEGERLVIGGVTNSESETANRQVPLFGDIPVLGWLFKQRGDRNASTELVVFITPSIVRRDTTAFVPGGVTPKQ